jgi:hypothetical protein
MSKNGQSILFCRRHEDRLILLQHGESFTVPEKILFSRQEAKGAKKKEFARIGLF